MKYQIGIDIGGTFTDCICLDERGSFWTSKVPTTPDDPSESFFRAIGDVARQVGLALNDFLPLLNVTVHGTTIATNAILTRTGAKVGVVTTRGFRDAIEMRNGIRDSLYDNSEPPPPLVPRYLRLPVTERIDARGSVTTKLKRGDVDEAIGKFRSETIESVAISFLHSYKNPEHELEVGRLVRKALPKAHISLSSRILPERGFYERASTAALDAYVGPLFTNYVSRLTRRLKGRLLIMQSSGGLMEPNARDSHPCRIINSGPAAGAIAATYFSGIGPRRDIISMDMGGTSCDVCIIRNGAPLIKAESTVAGQKLRVPMVDINSIGAGGGSIANIDRSGTIRVGPLSAGAVPGPACYDRGGVDPTVTDADLLLGYIDPRDFLGGRMNLSEDSALKAFETRVCKPLGLDVLEAAAGIFRIINTNMALAVREVTLERGLDPSKFTLIAAGGAGPIHACAVAQELGINSILVPHDAAHFCAIGMLISDLRHDYVRTLDAEVDERNADFFNSAFEEMTVRAAKVLTSEGVREKSMHFIRSMGLRYYGQLNELMLETREGTHSKIQNLLKAFHGKHQTTFGYSASTDKVQATKLRVTAIGRRKKFRLNVHRTKNVRGSRAIKKKIPMFLPSQGDKAMVEVYDGAKLSYGDKVVGPALVQLANSSLVIYENHHVVCDEYHNYVVEKM